MRIRYPKLRELKEALKAIFFGPYTSGYPHQPHHPAERFRGRPYFYKDDCTGCAACANVCPTGAIEVKDEIKNNKVIRRLILHWDICICCGQCQLSCLTQKGILLSQEFAYAVTENRQQLTTEIEKEFVCCECCAKEILPADQYNWLRERLGPLVFSNTSLLLFSLKLPVWRLPKIRVKKVNKNSSAKTA